MKRNHKIVALLLSVCLLAGCVIGGTLAWLQANTDPVTNTFTDSDINITLTETDTDKETEGEQHDYKMVPGWTIDKDPTVAVVDGSEDCWLFVRITESTNLDTYIDYSIVAGWTVVDDKDSNDNTIVIGRKVYADDGDKSFGIIGYTDTKDAADASDDVIVPNKVLVKDTVNKSMMDAIDDAGETKPTLTFQAYAVQLYKTNSDGNKESTTDEFDIDTAWEKAAGISSGS